MPYWMPIAVDGGLIDLSHLEPFELSVMPAGAFEAVTISVRFHDHCFTETYDPERHDGFVVTSQASRHERRAFNPERYRLSRFLPEIIGEIETKRIASTREGNMVRVTLTDGRIYPVFFTLRRENARRLSMFVVSAYAWTRHDRPATTGEMTFRVAVAKVLKGEKPRFPAR